MVSDRLRRLLTLMRSLALIVSIGAIGSLLTGCSLAGAVSSSPVTPLVAARSLGVPVAALVDIGDGFAAAVPAGGGIGVAVALKAGGEVRILTSSPGRAGQPSAHLLSYGGADLKNFNTFFYGTADGATSRVVVTLPGSQGGQVVAGKWLVAIPAPDLAPSDISWRFVGQDGAAILSGSGIFPPDA